MQLSKIKLAGFKSFVDPTTLLLPSKKVAIVGPNGCGKSNIIDAISWVMGESSPKYLRGESLTDVIFNGSSARKPVGQASVELIFDNLDGSIGGEYAKFAEISIKRILSREGDAGYFLNGVRCRKRDVVDIFLGTGLGPRSYSIIGQNMINRIIEAKPDDLRANLEEAAGISRYKERRHETELRIKHTRENLARVNDLRAELEKQLGHLKHQANVAERFKTLKQQERVLRAQWYTSQWRELDGYLAEYTLRIQREETAMQAAHSELSGVERELEQRRHDQHSAQSTFQEVQRRYYSIGNEITRIEQDILHHQEKQHQWESDLARAEQDWQGLKDLIEETQDNLSDMENDIQQIEPQLAAANLGSNQVATQLNDAEEAVQVWQNRWDAFNQQTSKITQTAQVEKNHIQHLEQKMAFINKRQTQLQQDQSKFNFAELNKEIEDFSMQSNEARDAMEAQFEILTDTREEITSIKLSQQEANTQLDRVRSELQQLKGQQASLEALQQTALGQRDNPAAPWVTQHGLESKPRLAQGIEVEAGWELVVEKVLGVDLQAICVEQLTEVVPLLDNFTTGNLCVFSSEATPAPSNAALKGVPLLQKIKSSWPLDSILSGIYVAASLDEALILCNSLNGNESVITQEGVWLNKSWLKILREQDPAAGVFHREQELKKLTQRIAELQATQKNLEATIAQHNDKLQELERQRDQLQASHSQQQAQVAQLSAQKKNKQERLLDLKSQEERCLKELAECTEQLQQAQAELNQARTTWQQALSSLEGQEQQREELVQERDRARQELQDLRQASSRHKEGIHELEIRLQTSKSQKSSLQQNVQRMHAQLTTLTERKTELQNDLSSMGSLDSLKESLSQILDKHVNVEAELNSTRATVDSIEQELRQLEEKRQLTEREINKIRGTLESLRLDCQGWKVKSDTIAAQLCETEYNLQDVLRELPQDVSVEEYQNRFEQMTQRINRLGPINLMAIDEYATCLERKEYLDKQLADLEAGLKILEDAIEKIDKETRARFKETFDKVNDRFQELFPSIFGGGKAYLELVGDNLLEAGVSVMACPPGKRNSSIHLLSGGEKALTAIALIFSIFHLNPAPFCLLDEVDAPLDDANVLRFCKLVTAMADKTQFFFISHNKVTIEMADHLIGVTMNEPGVSRLVSVDIEKAMSLVGVE